MSSPQCKVILYKRGNKEEKYCIFAEQLVENKRKMYQIPDTDIEVDSISKEIFLNPKYKIFQLSKFDNDQGYFLEPIFDNHLSHYSLNRIE